MNIFFAFILGILALWLVIMLINGLPKSIYYYFLVRRYNYIEPNNLIKFKQAIFNANHPLPVHSTFSLDNWNYYHYSKSLSNVNERVNLDLYDYDKAIIWYWISTHNKKLRTRK